MAKVQPIDEAQSVEEQAEARSEPKRPAHWRDQHGSGFEGREALLGQAMSMVIKTLSQTQPYQHQVNGALVLAHLGATLGSRRDFGHAFAPDGGDSTRVHG